MSNNSQINELLEEILDTDRSVEEVCAQHPELLSEVRERLKKFRSVEAQVDSLFPRPEVPLSGAPTEVAKITLPRADAEKLTIHGYELQTILGRGGMGVVYQAKHLKLNRTVALKMLLSGSHASEQEHLRFVREAEAVAGLRHPNVVQIYDFGDVAGQPFYTMEYIVGGSLAGKLAGGRQPVRECAQMVASLSRAVFAAHESGIIHRDLKPANILLGENNTPKISDFGLARRLDSNDGLTHTGARIGTPSYMAPEQMTGSVASVGPSVDIFALGAMLYEMLTGRPPFQGATLSETERKLTTEEPTPPSRVNANVPRDLETICLKCLEKDPQRRYATAGELAGDLERFLRHEPIRARPITVAERGMRWVRRNPLPAALAVTSIVLVALIAGWGMQEWTLASSRRAEKSRLTARLESGVQLVQAARLAEARAILGKLGDGGFEDLRQRIDRVLHDLDLAEELDTIGVTRATALNASDSTWQPNANASKIYEAAFARAGIGAMTHNPQTSAERIRASDIEVPLIAALDDWAACETDAQRRNWILEVARGADAEQSDWQKHSRDPAKWNDRIEITRLAETALAAKPSVQELRALGDRLDAAGLDSTLFRQQVQQEHVDSFLANLTLGDAFRSTNPAEAIRYYQAALAIRPQSATAHNNLAVALAKLGRSEEAIIQYEQSLALEPKSAIFEFNLGLELSKSRSNDALRHLRKAVELDPKLAVAQRTLGELAQSSERPSNAQAEGSALKRIDQASLQAAVSAAAKEMLIPGVAVLLRTPQGEFAVYFGTTELGANSSPNADTHFRIASNTKTMTSAIILQLAQEGKLKLGDAISKYVTSVPNGDKITLANLLEMRSGLYNYTNAPELSAQVDKDPTKVWTADELLAIAFKHPPNGPPGTEFEYCNTNYALLGLVIEKVDGRPLATVMQQRLFGPLSMTNTMLPTADSNEIPKPFSHGYLYGSSSVAFVGEPPYSPEVKAEAQAGKLLPRDYTSLNHSFATAAGGVVSTASNLAVWIKSLATGRLFNAEFQKVWHNSVQLEDPNEPEGQQYGYGITRMHWGPYAYNFHGGETPGFNSFMGYDATNDVTLVVWTNLTVSLEQTPTANAIMLKVLDLIYVMSPVSHVPMPAAKR